MQLRELTLTDFKNIRHAALTFAPRVNCFVGDNGMGKSNLLDAIHYLSFCRSFTGMTDRQLVNKDAQFTMAHALYLRRDVEEDIRLGISPGRRKSLKRGDKEYKRLTDHIGLLPLVMSAPADEELVRGPGEERRRWMNMVGSMGRHEHLDALVRYTRQLEQRNSLLHNGVVDHLAYEAVEAGLCRAAADLHRCRVDLLSRIKPVFAPYFRAISGEGEEPALDLKSDLNDGADMQALLDAARRRDEVLGYTTVGPHRDDVEFSINGMPIRRAGSQGQCKTFTVALRLAQYDFLAEATGIKPLLLLDDIFDKLDARRVERIMDLVGGRSEHFGQIFITDTNRAHLDEIMGRLSTDDNAMWHVEDGNFKPLPA